MPPRRAQSYGIDKRGQLYGVFKVLGARWIAPTKASNRWLSERYTVKPDFVYDEREKAPVSALRPKYQEILVREKTRKEPQKKLKRKKPKIYNGMTAEYDVDVSQTNSPIREKDIGKKIIKMFRTFRFRSRQDDNTIKSEKIREQVIDVLHSNLAKKNWFLAGEKSVKIRGSLFYSKPRKFNFVRL